jgi:PEGA domain
MGPLVRLPTRLVPAALLLAAGLALPARTPKAGYDLVVAQDRIVHVDPNDIVPVDLIPARPRLTVTSKPPGARLLRDGEPLGRTPLVVQVPAGVRIRLRLVLPGVCSLEREVVAWEDGEVSVDLVRASR